jgi:thiamine-monophosphate kinase
MTEAEWIAALRTLPLHPGARDLRDDAAVVDAGPLVVTTDTLVEGVHFLPQDPAGDVAWKLLASNLSDLAAKGAAVEGVLLNYPLLVGRRDDGRDDRPNHEWDRDFLAGFDVALRHFGARLIGGDTVSLPAGGARVLTLTAVGSDAAAPSRAGARAGDGLWVTGTIGDAGAGLRIARGEPGPAVLLDRYRRPTPRLAEGHRFAPVAHAMADVSDGLLIDAARMAAASGLAVHIDLAALPLSPEYLAYAGADVAAHLQAATAGDDYELLLAWPPDIEPPFPAFPIGEFTAGAGLSLAFEGEPVPLPSRLGFEHGRP